MDEMKAILSWVVAALLVMAVHLELDAASPLAASAAKIAAIVLIGFVYAKIAGPTTHQALLAGVVWIALAIAVEMVMTERLGHGWFALVGGPDAPVTRYAVMFVWIVGPALFARR